MAATSTTSSNSSNSQISLGEVRSNGLRDTSVEDNSTMATTIVPPPPMFADFDFDAALEELNTNPIYQPPAHWLRPLPYLEEITNCDNIKYINRERSKYPDAQCVHNVFGIANFVYTWSTLTNSELQYWKYDTKRIFYESLVTLRDNNIPYGMVRQGVVQSKSTGRLDSKWSRFYRFSQVELRDLVINVGTYSPSVNDSKRKLIRMLIKS